jgi:hypothetical protein
MYYHNSGFLIPLLLNQEEIVHQYFSMGNCGPNLSSGYDLLTLMELGKEAKLQMESIEKNVE